MGRTYQGREAIRFAIVIADVFMPPQQGAAPNGVSGALAIAKAIEDRLVSEPQFMDGRCLVVVSKAIADVSGELEAFLTKQTVHGTPWATVYSKRKGPSGLTTFQDSWEDSVIAAVKFLDDLTWRKTSAQAALEGVIVPHSGTYPAIWKWLQYSLPGFLQSWPAIMIEGRKGTYQEYIAKAIQTNLLGKGTFVEFALAENPVSKWDDVFIKSVQRARPGVLYLPDITSEYPERESVRLLQHSLKREIRGSIQRGPLFVLSTCDANWRGALLPDIVDELPHQTICIPPLSERRDDIMPFIRHSIRVNMRSRTGAASPKFDPEAERLLRAYDWPENELEALRFVRLVAADEYIGPDVVRAHFGTRRTAPQDNSLQIMSELRVLLKTVQETSEAVRQRLNNSRNFYSAAGIAGAQWILDLKSNLEDLDHMERDVEEGLKSVSRSRIIETKTLIADVTRKLERIRENP